MITRRGQSIIEYTMIVGILTVVLFYMGTSIKRGVQSLVKVAADQVGSQQNADQDFNDTSAGYMLISNTETQASMGNEVTEFGYIDNVTKNIAYVMNTIYNEATNVTTNSMTNGGFSPG